MNDQTKTNPVATLTHGGTTRRFDLVDWTWESGTTITPVPDHLRRAIWEVMVEAPGPSYRELYERARGGVYNYRKAPQLVAELRRLLGDGLADSGARVRCAGHYERPDRVVEQAPWRVDLLTHECAFDDTPLDLPDDVAWLLLSVLFDRTAVAILEPRLAALWPRRSSLGALIDATNGLLPDAIDRELAVRARALRLVTRAAGPTVPYDPRFHRTLALIHARAAWDEFPGVTVERELGYSRSLAANLVARAGAIGELTKRGGCWVRPPYPTRLEVDDLIRRELLRLGPGAGVPADDALAERWEVAAAVIADALARLRWEGWIERERVAEADTLAALEQDWTAVPRRPAET